MSSDDWLQPLLKMSEAEFQMLSDEDQLQLLSLLDQEVADRKKNRLLSYVPYDKQLKFHSSPAPIRAIFGGNRSGKTTAGGMEFLFHMTGQYPEWYPKDLRLEAPLKGRIVAKDLQKGVGEVIIPFLDEWLDPSLVLKRVRNPIGIATKYILHNGSQFDILTHEMSTEQFEGWKGHVAWFDEPPPRDKYIATLRGLVDYSGSCWLTLTPLTQPWIYDEIYTKANDPDTDVFCIVADITDNPYLGEAAIKQFASRLTEEEREARMHGRFLHLTGLVYKDFSPDIHIVEPSSLPDLNKCTRYFCIDPHERMPTACLWVAADSKDNHWVYDELWLSNMNIEQVSQAIKAQEGFTQPHIRLIDPHNDKENTLAGDFNIKKELAKYGVYCQRANSDPFLGKSRLRDALKPQYSHVRKRNVSQFKISRYCTQTIYEFQHYIYDEHRRNRDEYDLKEKVKKKNDHFMDCLRYIYNFGPRMITNDEEDTVTHYEGEYAKYPVRSASKPSPSGVSYDNLVERGK